MKLEDELDDEKSIKLYQDFRFNREIEEFLSSSISTPLNHHEKELESFLICLTNNPIIQRFFYEFDTIDKNIVEDTIIKIEVMLKYTDYWCCNTTKSVIEKIFTNTDKYTQINEFSIIIEYFKSLRKIPFLVIVNWEKHIASFVHYYDNVYYLDYYSGIGRKHNYFFTKFSFDNWINIIKDIILNVDNTKLFNFTYKDKGKLEWFRIYTDLMNFSIRNVLLKLNDEFSVILHVLNLLENDIYKKKLDALCYDLFPKMDVSENTKINILSKKLTKNYLFVIKLINII